MLCVVCSAVLGYDASCVACGLCCAMCGLMFNVWCGVWLLMCDVLCAVWGVWCAACSMYGALFLVCGVW